jgi:hypothetical protein
MLPSKPKKLTTTHSCFDCKNYKLLQQWRSSPVTRSKEALFFAIFETAFTSLRDARAPDHFHGIAGESEAPFSKRCLKGMADRIEFPHDCCRGSIFKTLVTIGRDICAGELGKRAVHNRSAQHRVNARCLSVCATLGR